MSDDYYYYSPPAYEPSPPPYYEPPVYHYPPPVYYEPPPVYYEPPPYYAPPAYYEPPSYYSPPAYEPSPYSYTPPDYSYTPPSYSYTPPSYSDPVSSYTPDPYNWGQPTYSWTPLDLTKPSYNEFLYTSDPMAYNTEQIKGYVEDTYGVPYEQYQQDYYGRGAGAANLGYTPSYSDPDGFYDDYSAPSNAQYYGAPSDAQYYGSEAYSAAPDAPSYSDPVGSYFDPVGSYEAYSATPDAQYFTPEAIASTPESAAFNLPQNQFAAVNPQFSDTVSDSYESPMASVFSRSLGGEGGAAAPVSSGAGASAGIVPSATGGFELQTGSGETIKLNDADSQDLLSGRKTVADIVADKAESGAERFGQNVVATKGLSLPDAEAPYGYGPNGRPLANDPAFAAAQREIADMNEARDAQRGGRTFERVPAFGASEAPSEPNPFLGKMPEYDPAKMEGTRAQYGARQADEMARAAAGVPANQDEYAQYMADRDRYNVSEYVTPANQRSFDANLRDIMDNRGGFTSQWQTVGSDRVMVNDDGTGIGINENGDPYSLTAREVDQMIRNKQLNTRESGYVAATGGTGDRPGGSPKDSGFKLPFKFDAKAESKSGGGGGGGGGGGKDDKKKKGGISPALLLGILAALAANRGKGGAAGPSIPGRALQRAQTDYGNAGRRAGSSAQQYFTGPGIVSKAEGGMLDDAYAGGGIASLSGYSDGGRLLRGPGDGVSDSIPAMIGKKQPARLADGEFVVPARIVSELGNGSTEAGARKLYAMMDRVQKDRRKSVGKNKVAVNSRADKHLPK